MFFCSSNSLSFSRDTCLGAPSANLYTPCLRRVFAFFGDPCSRLDIGIEVLDIDARYSTSGAISG